MVVVGRGTKIPSRGKRRRHACLLIPCSLSDAADCDTMLTQYGPLLPPGVLDCESRTLELVLQTKQNQNGTIPGITTGFSLLWTWRSCYEHHGPYKKPGSIRCTVCPSPPVILEPSRSIKIREFTMPIHSQSMEKPYIAGIWCLLTRPHFQPSGRETANDRPPWAAWNKHFYHPIKN
jgi:hypothetical protein